MRTVLVLFLAMAVSGAVRAQNDTTTDGDMTTVFGSNIPAPSETAPTAETNLPDSTYSPGGVVTEAQRRDIVPSGQEAAPPN